MCEASAEQSRKTSEGKKALFYDQTLCFTHLVSLTLTISHERVQMQNLEHRSHTASESQSLDLNLGSLRLGPKSFNFGLCHLFLSNFVFLCPPNHCFSHLYLFLLTYLQTLGKKKNK